MATVILDAGHGGYDAGASNGERLEKNDNLKLVLSIGQKLSDQGVDVLYTRTEDIYQSPNEKAGIANRSGADYLISIHRNSSPNQNMYSGVESLVYRNSGIPALFAQNINRRLGEAGFTDLGIQERPNLAVLKGTTMPAVLVEVGFINTDADNAFLDANFEEVTDGIAQGILETIQGAMVSAAQFGSYQIEIGSFRHPDNAIQLADCLQRDGYSSYQEMMGEVCRVCHGRFKSLAEAEQVEKKLFEAGYETKLIFVGDQQKNQ